MNVHLFICVRRLLSEVVKPYSIGLYVDPNGAAKALARFKGLSIGSLVEDEGFFKSIITGSFDRVIVLVFARSIGESMLRNAFTSALKGRLGDGGNVLIDKLANKFSGESSWYFLQV